MVTLRIYIARISEKVSRQEELHLRYPSVRLKFREQMARFGFRSLRQKLVKHPLTECI